MKALAKIIREEAGRRVQNKNGVCAADIVDWLFKRHGDDVEEYLQNEGIKYRSITALTERILKENAESEQLSQTEFGPTQETIQTVIEACPGLPRCVSFMEGKNARYVAWYHATEAQLLDGIAHYESHIGGLKAKVKSIGELVKQRRLMGVPKAMSIQEWKEK